MTLTKDIVDLFLEWIFFRTLEYTKNENILKTMQ